MDPLKEHVSGDECVRPEAFYDSRVITDSGDDCSGSRGTVFPQFFNETEFTYIRKFHNATVQQGVSGRDRGLLKGAADRSPDAGAG
jgi:hypothetical protein